jgi:hypothetical protein
MDFLPEGTKILFELEPTKLIKAEVVGLISKHPIELGGSRYIIRAEKNEYIPNNCYNYSCLAAYESQFKLL